MQNNSDLSHDKVAQCMGFIQEAFTVERIYPLGHFNIDWIQWYTLTLSLIHFNKNNYADCKTVEEAAQRNWIRRVNAHSQRLKPFNHCNVPEPDGLDKSLSSKAQAESNSTYTIGAEEISIPEASHQFDSID